jgi:superfamily II DNA or RNA helicase
MSTAQHVEPAAPHLSLRLRPYQEQAITALDRAWSGDRRPSSRTRDYAAVSRAVVVLPTGAGKTHIFANVLARAHAEGRRGLVLVHREPLLDQSVEKLRMVAPTANVGVVAAERNDIDADIIVGSVQTLGNPKRRAQINIDPSRSTFGIGIYDEMHHSAAPGNTETLAGFGAFRERGHPLWVPWAGFTATLSREDERGLGDIWEEVAYSRSIQEMIDDGYLVPPRGIRVQVEDLNLDAVKKSRGDLQANDLGDALMNADAPYQGAKALLEHAVGRHTAAFWPTVQVAQIFADECHKLGITCEVVVGTTPKDERRDAYARFREGITSVISSVSVLSEGWDAPWCDCILLGRPTQSKALFVQICGRALRPWIPGGKTDALIIDLTGASERNQLITLADLGLSVEGEEADPEESSTPDPDAVDMFGDEPVYGEGVLRSHAVDLFAASRSLWLRTEDRGWWFVPVMGGVFFLYPKADGTFAVGYKQNNRTAQVIEGKDPGLTLELGMAWAERYAAEVDSDRAEHGFSVSSRSASWRKGNRPSSPAQRDLAAGLGIDRDLSASLNKRELSDLISIKIATRALKRVN